MAEQNYKNHARWHPFFHFFLMPMNVALFIASILHVIKQPTPPNVLLVPVTFSLLLGTLTIRMYAVKNQDRLIRLEETLRMQAHGISPDGLTVRQFVALRFVSDAELAGLVARARTEGLTGKQIKASIVHWRADHDRI